MKVYLIRHTAVDVPAGYAYGQTDVPLKDTFQEEAEQVKNTIQKISFDKVFTSPLSRCTKLADYCGFDQAEKDNHLLELNFGEWEMKSWEEISMDSRSEVWFSNWIQTACPNGESFQDQYKRVEEFLQELKKKEYQNVCIFAHGGVLTAARVYKGLYSIEEAFKNIPSYGEVISFDL